MLGGRDLGGVPVAEKHSCSDHPLIVEIDARLRISELILPELSGHGPVGSCPPQDYATEDTVHYEPHSAEVHRLAARREDDTQRTNFPAPLMSEKYA